MITPEMVTLASIGVTVLLAQRAQNNTLVERLEEGLQKRQDALEKRQDEAEADTQALDLRLTTVETVCRMRHLPRPDSPMVGV